MVKTPEEVMKRINSENLEAVRRLEIIIDNFLDTWDGEKPISVGLGQRVIPAAVRDEVVALCANAGWEEPKFEARSGDYYFSMYYAAPKPKQ